MSGAGNTHAHSASPSCPGPQEGLSERLPFFVYGTLRPGERNHHAFLQGRTVREEPAVLPGAVLYEGPGFPYLVEAPSGAEGAPVVHGELATVEPAAYETVLRDLDRLEGYVPGDRANHYERVCRELHLPDGGVTLAWVYVAAERTALSLRGGALVPEGNWLSPPSG